MAASGDKLGVLKNPGRVVVEVSNPFYTTGGFSRHFCFVARNIPTSFRFEQIAA
jgi:hypothetical protein